MNQPSKTIDAYIAAKPAAAKPIASGWKDATPQMIAAVAKLNAEKKKGY